MAWYSVISYLPPSVSGATPDGAVGGGWTDVGGRYHVSNLGPGDNVVETFFNGSTPWTNGQMVRKAANETIQNSRVRIRYRETAGNSGTQPANPSYAPWLMLRYNGSDSAASACLVRTSSKTSISGGVAGAVTDGSLTSTYTVGNWYDLEVTSVTSGGTTALVEKTWTVADHVASGFGSGATITPVNGNTYTDTQFTGAGAVGFFFYQPSTAQVAFFSTETDTPATALTLSPSVASSSGAAVGLSLSVNGAQNGGAISFSDGGAGGSFSPANLTLGAGVNATASFSYIPRPGSSGTVTVTAASAALTGSSISGTAAVAVNVAASQTARRYGSVSSDFFLVS